MTHRRNTTLPYVDSKPVGAADFYYAINATFKFIRAKGGKRAWRRYLAELGQSYFARVNAGWRQGGLPAVARYWREFFNAEPGARVGVREGQDKVELRVQQCPAIRHLKASSRVIMRDYCEHCYHLGQARAAAAGLQMRLTGGNGQCVHVYAKQELRLPRQRLSAIERVD